jgi:hypothetical protein
MGLGAEYDSDRGQVFPAVLKGKDMTLCIAAVCDDEESEGVKIVLCADMQRQSEGIGGCETEDKLGFVKVGWPTLIAGTITRANDLLNVYAGHLNSSEVVVDEYNLIDHLRRPAHLQKQKLVEEYLRQTYAFDHGYFYGEGAQKLPETFITKVTADIERIKLDASLLICGFLDESDFSNRTVCKRPFIGVVDEYQSASGTQEYVRIETEFAAIGSGNYTALATLYRRQQESTDSLARTLYHVWEANRLSENVPGVGKDYLALYVLYPSGKMEQLTSAGFKHFRGLYRKFGPKAIRKTDARDLELKPEFFGDINAED